MAGGKGGVYALAAPRGPEEGGHQPVACDLLPGRVPQADIDGAVANPSTVSGFGPVKPNLPPNE